MSTVLDRRAAPPMRATDAPAPPARRLPRVVPYAVYAVAQLLQVAVLHSLVPRFFWLDDSQAQFGSMAWWLGRHLRGGVPPLVDPGQGASGNAASDMQYGSFDPMHWLIDWVLGRNDDLLVMSWEYGAGCMFLLGLGALALLRRYRVPAAWAVAAAIGIASSGFFLWYGSVWWPLMLGTAWLPWVWLGLATRGPVGVLVTGMACWGVLASGSPYSIPFAAVIVLAQLAERRRAAGSWRTLLRDRPTWLRFVALVGGGLVAAPTLLNAVQVGSAITRPVPEDVIGNVGTEVPNLLDSIVGGPTLLGQTVAFNGAIGLVPALTTFVVCLPALALVRWRAAVRCPGVLTGLALAITALAATQLPTVMTPFRFPFRYLAVSEVALPLLVLIAVRAAGVFSRRRRRVAAGLVGVQLALAVARAPALTPWHVLGAAITAAALACMLRSRPAESQAPGQRSGGRSRVLRAVAACSLVVLSALPLVVGERMMVTVQQRLDARGFTGDPTKPYRDIGVPDQSGSGAMGTTVDDFRNRSMLTDQTATVYAWGPFTEVFGADRGWGRGFFAGNSNLLAGAEVGTGYVTSPHVGLEPILCTEYVGNASCPDASTLLAEAPATGRPWVDVLSADTVVLSRSAPADLQAYFDRAWDRGSQNATWTFYGRRAADRLPGRVADAAGVQVASTGWTAGLGRVGSPEEVYTVTTSDTPGSLLLRVPWWPGYRATVDGRPVPVSALAGALVQVTVPAGVRNGRLEVEYAPIGARVLFPSIAAGIVLLLVAVAAAGVLERRSRRAR